MVSVGDVAAEEDTLIEPESDKATMEVPSPIVGEVLEIKVKEGDEVSKGALPLRRAKCGRPYCGGRAGD